MTHGLALSVGLVAGGPVLVSENQQVTQTLSYLLKGEFITHIHGRETGDFWEVVWQQTFLQGKSRDPFPTLNISYSWAWGWKVRDGLQKYKMPNVVLVSRRNTFIFMKERTEKMLCLKTTTKKPPTFVFSMTHIVQNELFFFVPSSRPHPLFQTSWNFNIVELDLKKKRIKWETKMLKTYTEIFHDVYFSHSNIVFVHHFIWFSLSLASWFNRLIFW